MTEITFRSDFSVDLVRSAGNDDAVLQAMLVSTLKDGLVMDEAAKKGRIAFMMKNLHGSVFEHNMMTFRVEAPIFVFREWHRHRIGIGINEASGRYTELPPVFYIPGPERPLVQVGKPGAYEYVAGSTMDYEWLVADMKDNAARQYLSYKARLNTGIAKEVARMSLGVNIYSTMYWTCNARSMMAFLSLRTNEPKSMFPSKPMKEIEVCARMMEAKFAELFPITYEAFCEHGRVCP